MKLLLIILATAGLTLAVDSFLIPHYLYEGMLMLLNTWSGQPERYNTITHSWHTL